MSNVKHVVVDPVSIAKPGTGHWTHEEDQILFHRLKTRPYNSWMQVEPPPGRTIKQCRERWRNHLDPTILRTPFTPEEDQVVVDKYREFGNRWSLIAAYVPGRSDHAIRRRLKQLKPNVETASGRPKRMPGSEGSNLRPTGPPRYSSGQKICSRHMEPIGKRLVHPFKRQNAEKFHMPRDRIKRQTTGVGLLERLLSIEDSETFLRSDSFAKHLFKLEQHCDVVQNQELEDNIKLRESKALSQPEMDKSLSELSLSSSTRSLLDDMLRTCGGEEVMQSNSFKRLLSVIVAEERDDSSLVIDECSRA